MDLMMNGRAHVRSYRDLLTALGQVGSPSLTHAQAHAVSLADRKAGYLCVRHDVDHRLDVALQMARIEHEVGVKASYYLLPPGDYDKDENYYGRLEGATIVPTAALRDGALELQALGHEVGLHNDFIQLGARLRRPPADLLAEQIAWFAGFGVPVTGSASHGSRFARTHGFLNYELFQERRGPNSQERRIDCGDGMAVDLYSVSMQALGLAYEAYSLPRECYISDTGSNFTVERTYLGEVSLQAVLELIGPARKIMALIHADWWKVVPPRRSVAERAAADAAAAAAVDAAHAQATAEAEAWLDAQARAAAEVDAKAEAQAPPHGEAIAPYDADARARAEEQARLALEAEADARALAEAQARERANEEAREREEAQARAAAQAQALAEERAREKAEAQAREREEALAREAEARARAEQEALARVAAEALAREQAEARAQAEASALAAEQARAVAEAEAQARAASRPTLADYAGVLALLKARGDVEFITYDDMDWGADDDYVNSFPDEWKHWRQHVRSDKAAARKVHVLIQHDTDSGPDQTIAMARLEADFGVRSSIMTFARRPLRVGEPAIEDYRIDWEALRGLQRQGFVVGYHCNALHLTCYDEAAAPAAFDADLEALAHHGLRVDYFTAHGGNASPDGRTNSAIDYPVLAKKPVRWVNTRFSPRFDGYFSDGGSGPGRTGAERVADLHDFIAAMIPGGRYRILLHAQYFDMVDLAGAMCLLPPWPALAATTRPLARLLGAPTPPPVADFKVRLATRQGRAQRLRTTAKTIVRRLFGGTRLYKRLSQLRNAPRRIRQLEATVAARQHDIEALKKQAETSRAQFEALREKNRALYQRTVDYAARIGKQAARPRPAPPASAATATDEVTDKATDSEKS